MLLKIIQLCMTESFKKKKISELFQLTADAFQSDLPELRGFSFAECLSKYALFTKEKAENCLKSGLSLEEVKYRLYKNSYIFGRSIRKSLHIVTWKEAVIVLKVIYKFIGIDFHYNRQGEIIIKQCFFSKYYSGEVCKFISSLDSGLAAGLSGGGKLSFNQSITEGNKCCKGFLYKGL
jgi:hypothetical protein